MKVEIRLLAAAAENKTTQCECPKNKNKKKPTKVPLILKFEVNFKNILKLKFLINKLIGTLTLYSKLT